MCSETVTHFSVTKKLSISLLEDDAVTIGNIPIDTASYPTRLLPWSRTLWKPQITRRKFRWC